MLIDIIIFASFAGITVFLGGLLAKFFNHHAPNSPIKYEIVHTLMSFGVGIMLSALALVLIPKGMHHLSLLPLIISFASGSLLFFVIDRYLQKQGGQVSTLLAMVMDFIPESIALGAVFALEPEVAILLAIFIGLQNLPESFNAYRELVHSGFTAGKTLIIFFFLSFSGVLGALLGHLVLSDFPKVTSQLMIFASGGILYLLVQDIIPESKLKNSYGVSLGAALGFLIGMIGEKLI